MRAPRAATTVKPGPLSSEGASFSLVSGESASVDDAVVPVVAGVGVGLAVCVVRDEVVAVLALVLPATRPS